MMASAGASRSRMQRGLLLLCVVALLAGPWVATRLPTPAEEASMGAASAAAPLRIITPHPRAVRQAFASAFGQWHARKYGMTARVRFLVPGGSNDVVRYLKELYAAQARPDQSVGVDVAWGGGDYTFEHELKDFLSPLEFSRQFWDAVYPQRDLGGVPLLDPQDTSGPRWAGVVLSSFGIVSSPVFLQDLGLPIPGTWRDLTQPAFRGLLAFADPTRSGSAAMVYMMVLQREMATAQRSGEALSLGFDQGMRTLTAIAANARYFTDSSTRPCEDVANADAAAGVAIDFYARSFQQAFGDERVTYRAPEAATAITPDPVAVLRGTTGSQRTLAHRFVEFLLSDTGQRLWALPASASEHLTQSLRRLPIRAQVYANRKDFVDDVNPFEQARSFNVHSEWMSMFGARRMLWAAAYIDAGKELRHAYERLSSIDDVERRDIRLTSLWSLPVEYSGVLIEQADMRAERARPDSKLLLARRRQHWASVFREHYQRVESEL